VTELAQIVKLPGTSGAVVTKRQLAMHLQVSERTIERWTRAGMPVDKWRNGMVRFHVRDVEAWLRSAA
jgi:phage terminase Nu1 subunit (DNA packaging protein)